MLLGQCQMTSKTSISNAVSQNETKPEDNKQNSSISTDSTHEANPKKQKYIFENDKKSYELNMILYDEKIKIKIFPLSDGKDEYFYEKEFSQDDLGKLNKVFKLCSDIDDSFFYFNQLFNDKNNQLSVKENNDIIKLEKKIKLSPTLKIEFSKIKKEIPKYENNKEKNSENSFNNDINLNIGDSENISQLNITNEKLLTENKKNKIHNFLYNNKEESDIMELPEEQEDENELDNDSSKKNIRTSSKFKSSNNSTEEKKQNNNSSLLNKKRTTNSDLSDISFNSLSNENEYINIPQKKSKNSLDKEDFLKIFSDNGSINSGESSEKFFIKVQKDLEKNKKNKDKEQKNLENNLENKKEQKEHFLYDGPDSSEEIKDDIYFFKNQSNKSPIIIPLVPKINDMNELKENNFDLFNKEQYFNNINKTNQNYFQENNYESNMIKNYKNCISSIQNIQIEEGNNNINNINNGQYENYFNEKIVQNNISSWKVNSNYNKNYLNKYDNSYRIIHKNFIEFCNNDNYNKSNDKGDNNNLNNLFAIESDIIKGYSEIDFIIKYLQNKFNKKMVDGIRIYQASVNGAKSEDFHSACDGTTNVIVLIKTKDGKKFGGYTSVGFNSFNRSCYDDTAFIFSIDKREIYPNIKGKYAIESYYNLGPCFSGESIKIFDNFLQRGGITCRNCGNFETNEDYQINSGKKAFEIEEIEVIEFIEMKNDDESNIYI